MSDHADHHLAPTMIPGVHGVLDLEPWIRRAHDGDSLEEDMYSLVVYDAMTIRPARPAEAMTTARDGLALPLAGEVRTEGMRPGPAFRCRVRAGSLDVATWTTEIFVDALRSTGTTAPALITVSARERTQQEEPTQPAMR
ncbi:hypothetical protein [Streptomyces sp. 029-5]|uniref:hypothetical protein n=1 Tax=Streptomyces sp. 029-5 TaxID=2789261 RepID=UPI0039803A22